MEIFNYVMVLASIILGLGITHLLQGVVAIAQHPGRYKPYWVHLVWVVSTFIGAIFWWWWEFRLSQTAVWTFQLYLFVLLYALIIYVNCALLFPSDLKEYAGYEEFYYSRRRWLLGIGVAHALADVADTLLKGWAHFTSLGWSYPVAIAAMLVLFTGGMITQNRRYHATVALLLLAYQLALAFMSFQTVA